MNLQIDLKLASSLFRRRGWKSIEPPLMQFICLSKDKNHLHCRRISTTYNTITQLRGNGIRGIRQRQQCPINNAVFHWRQAITFFCSFQFFLCQVENITEK